MIAARKWRVEHRTVATEGHMPFEGHRTVAEVDRERGTAGGSFERSDGERR